MKVLVLGATGYIGTRLIAWLQADGRWQALGAARHAGAGLLCLDARDAVRLTQALRGMDAVVNCVAGSAAAIADGARALAVAVQAAQVPAVIHVSSMAVYGDRQGPVDETCAPGRPRGWYARAKLQAEETMAALAQATAGPGDGTRVTVLRPGCVWGPGSALWVGRIARWLAQGRLGDLGAAGDGWSHGVFVDDVCQAILRALQQPPAPGAPRILNLAAPDSPRWNAWFTDLALGLGLTPLRRVGTGQLRADAYGLGPPLHLARALLARAGAQGVAQALPDAISPGLLRLWQSTLRMDASAATRELGLDWTAYPAVLRQCIASLRTDDGTASAAARERPTAVRAR